MHPLRMSFIRPLLLTVAVFFLHGVGSASAAKVDTTWTASGPGTLKVAGNGTAADPQLDYSAPDRFDGIWAFSATAASTRALPVKWEATGFYGWFRVVVKVERFVKRGGVEVLTETLGSAGPVDCCDAPSGGFAYKGTSTFNLQKGDVYGFRASGSHFTGGPIMQGSLIVREVDDSGPRVTPVLTGQQGENGIYTGPVSVKWTTTDDDSRVSATKGCEAATVSEDTAGKTFTCAATSAGGTTTQSVTIVRDTTAPELTVPPTAVQQAPGAGGTVVEYRTSATDAIDAAPAIACSPASGTRFPVGTTTVTCTASDAAGNATTKSFDALVFVATAQAASPAPTAAPGLKSINAVLAFQFKIAKQTTRLVQLRVKNVPAGATVVVTCKGKSCPKSLKGKGRTLTSKGSTLSLATLVKTGLKSGTTINVTISSPGAITSIKTLMVRKGKAPKVANRCVPVAC